MKKIMISIVVLCLVGCTGNVTKENSKITGSDDVIAPGYRKGDNVSVQQGSIALDIDKDIGDSKVMFDSLKIVALVHIDSIIGGDNYSTLGDEYVLPYTYGKMTIQQVYKGNIAIDSQVIYYRVGGTVSYAKYYEGSPIAHKEKIDSHTNESTVLPDYVKLAPMNDIDIEVGKDYIVYLMPETVYHGNDNEYAISGFQGGLREVQGNLNTKSDIQVYNNFTKLGSR